MKKLRGWALIAPIVLLFVQSSCKKEEPLELTADFTYTKNSESVVFENTSENWTQCAWFFGDGDSVVNEANPTHVYEQYGSYTVRLVVWSYEGGTREIVKQVEPLYEERPLLTLKEESGWGLQHLVIENALEMNYKKSGHFFLSLSYNENFSEDEMTFEKFRPDGLPGEFYFKDGLPTVTRGLKNPEGVLLGLKPNTTYFVKAIFSFREKSDSLEVVTVSDVVSFTTKSFPALEVSHNVSSNCNTIDVYHTTIDDPYDQTTQEVRFFQDSKMEVEITPWNWNADNLTFSPHLGETVYVAYRVEVLDEIIEAYDEVTSLNNSCFFNNEPTSLSITKVDQGFVAYVSSSSRHWSELIINCTQKKVGSQTAYEMKHIGLGTDANYTLLVLNEYGHFLNTSKGYELVESEFTQNQGLGYHYFSFNNPKLIFKDLVNSKTLEFPNVLIRIDD